jgi:hypothetical protein
MHALADFDVQIEAGALRFMALLGLGVARPEGSLRDLPDLQKIFEVRVQFFTKSHSDRTESKTFEGH